MPQRKGFRQKTGLKQSVGKAEEREDGVDERKGRWRVFPRWTCDPPKIESATKACNAGRRVELWTALRCEVVLSGKSHLPCHGEAVNISTCPKGVYVKRICVGLQRILGEHSTTED